jgi:TPR repeat protein
VSRCLVKHEPPRCIRILYNFSCYLPALVVRWIVSRERCFIMSDMKAHLDKIRSDAAECRLLSSIANSEKREMFATIAEHLNSLAFEVERSMVVEGAHLPFVEHRSAEFIADLPAVPIPAISTPHVTHEVKKSRRVLPWLAIVFVVLSVGLLSQTQGTDSPFFSSQRWLPFRNEVAEEPKLSPSETQEQKRVADQLSTLTARFGSLEKALDNLKTARAEPPTVSSDASAASAEAIAALKTELLAVRRDLEANAALLSKANDEANHLKKTADTLNTTLQDELKKSAALTSELTSARRDVESATAFARKAGDEAARLQRSLDSANATLRVEREKSDALADNLADARHAQETKTLPVNNVGRDTIGSTRASDAKNPEAEQEAKKQATEANPSNKVVMAKPSAVTSMPTQSGNSDAKLDSETSHLIARAQLLLSQGNINGARAVLERAIEMGSSKASFVIAETYDPAILPRWNVYGTRGDIAKAREYYAKAADGGNEEAKGRLRSLH